MPLGLIFDEFEECREKTQKTGSFKSLLDRFNVCVEIKDYVPFLDKIPST